MRALLRLTVFLCVLALCCPLGATAAAKADKDKVEEDFEALRRFSQVLDLVNRYYVKDVNQGELLDGALKGMLQGLDPHSTFMTPEEHKEMQETTSGEFTGIGIEITVENGQVTVVTPIEDTPAYRAGLQSGDVILTINGQPTQELSLQDVVSRIRGPKGTEVELGILHSTSKSPKTIRVKREAIPLVSVKSKPLEDGYYWIRLTRFSGRTDEDLRDALKKATRECAKTGGLKGIVLDLRNNPGGLLDQAVSVSDMFLSKGTIVSIQGRGPVPERIYEAKDQAGDIDVPVVVIINAGSASASEIVAGALRDQKRALIIGERSFGKGSVQNIIPLSDGSALKLTVALYYTPSGSSIQAEGIVPDLEIPFERPREEDADEPRILLREQNLSGHLENADGGKKATSSKKRDDAAEQLARDNQLRLMIVRRDSLERVGLIDCFDYDASNRRAAIGLLVDPACTRQGLGRDALETFMEYAFRFLHLHQLYVHIAVCNTASLGLFRACGFRECGHLADWVRLPHGYTDALVFQKINPAEND